MQLTSRLDFAADPATVSAMLTNPEYLKAVCAASDALSSSVEVNGSSTKTKRTLPTPSVAAKFTGDTITVVDEVTWPTPAADGSRAGALKLSMPGLPVTMNGEARLAPGGRGTVIDYDADLVVNLPFVGKKMEQGAAPALLAAIQIQQRVGDDWLAKR